MKERQRDSEACTRICAGKPAGMRKNLHGSGRLPAAHAWLSLRMHQSLPACQQIPVSSRSQVCIQTIRTCMRAGPSVSTKTALYHLNTWLTLLTAITACVAVIFKAVCTKGSAWRVHVCFVSMHKGAPGNTKACLQAKKSTAQTLGENMSLEKI